MASPTSDNVPRETVLPPLRPEVRLERTAAGLCLHDEAQRFRAVLDEDVGALAGLLDGRRTAADLATALAERGVRVGPAEVEAALATLDGMFLLENERGRGRAGAVREEEAAARGAEGPSGARLAVLAGDRFDCHACGYCCSNGQSFGPITEEDRAHALAHDWVGEIPGVSGPEDLFREVFDGPVPQAGAGSDAAPRGEIYLVQHGGRCVFLDEDGLCRIHKRLGYEAKPFMCRAFPFAFARTPEGPVVSTRRECKSIERSRRTGTPVERRLASLEALAAEHPEPIVADALVPFCGPVTVPWRLARAIRAAALHALEGPAAGEAGGDVLDRLLAVRDLVAGVSARLGERPGEAELGAALAFAEGRSRGPAPAPAPVPDTLARDARAALASLAQELVDNVMKAGLFLRFEAPDTGAVRREEQDAAAVALLELLALLKPTLARPIGPVPPFAAAERRARIALDTRDGAPAAEVLRDALRHEVHGWAVVSRAPLLFGYALLALRAAIALCHARRCAAAAGASSVSNEEMHRGVLLASRSLGGASNERIALRDPRRILTFFRGVRFGDPL